MLIKIHLPYIAAIWVYERWIKAYKKPSGGHQLPSTYHLPTRPFTPKRSHPASRGGPGFSAQTPGALSGKSDQSLIRTPGTDRDVRSAATDVELHQLKLMIAGLSEQIRELTSRLDSTKTGSSVQSPDLLS